MRTVIAALALSFLAAEVLADPITVCGDGTCDYTSINAAIDAANPGDVILLSAETYTEGMVINTDGKAITIRGVLDNAGEPASVLDGANMHRVLICQNGEDDLTVFEQLVIRNGLVGGDYPDNMGGGMKNISSSPTLTDCTFTNNSADGGGGGMYNQDSSPTLTECTFTNNSAGIGGGMYNISSSSPILSYCTFTGNSATGNKYSTGGGIYNNSSCVNVRHSIFTSNTAVHFGGGMASTEDGCDVTLHDCLFEDNTALYGGGVCFDNCSPTITYCKFTGNTATCGGAVMNWLDADTVTMNNCIFGPNSHPDIDGLISMTTMSVSIPASVPGDMDGDEDVDADDFVALRDQIGTDALGCVVADVDGDGQVGPLDLAFVLGGWGVCP